MGEGDTLLPGLFAWIEIAFQHETHDGLAVFTELAEDFARHHTLAPMVFTGVVMGTVDHDGTGDALARYNGFRARHVFGFIVGFSATASQHDMAIRVTHGLDDRGEPIGIDAQKMVRLLRGDHGIPGHFKIALCTVLEADRHRQPAGHFPVRLAFGGTGPYGDPTPKIGDVLGGYRVQGFSRAGDPSFVDIEQNRPGQFQARSNVACAIQMRIVDEPLPPNRRAGLFKVGAHDDQQPVAQCIGHWFQSVGILVGRFRVMDRTRANDHQQALTVLPVQNATDRFPGFKHQRGGLVGNRQC